MKTGIAGRQLIEEYEGLILGAYDDFNDHIVKPGESVRGTLTIGYGHTTSAGGPKVVIGQRITKEQADQFLAQDLGRVENDVNRLVKVPINQNQFDALVSFHYNTGALGRSGVLKKLNAKDYQGAADALLQWTRGNGQVLQGLVRRRKSERVLFLKPSVIAVTPKTATAGAVVAGTAGAVAAAPQHWYWIIGSAIVILIIGGIAIFIYERNK